MKKYSVTIPYAVFVTVEVKAEDKQDAIENAFNKASIASFVGNGAYDRLIGVYEGSIEAGDEPIDIPPFEIQVEEK